MAEIKIVGTGKIRDERIEVELDFGFGRLVLDVEQSAMADLSKVDDLDAVLSQSYDSILSVLGRLAGATEAKRLASDD